MKKLKQMLFICLLLVIGLLSKKTVLAYNDENGQLITTDLSTWNNIKVLNLSDENEIAITDPTDHYYYSFTATSGDYYKLDIISNIVNIKINIYNSKGEAEYYTSKSASYTSKTFYFKFNEGEEYYLEFGAQENSSNGTYTVSIKNITFADTIKITNHYDNEYYSENGKNISDDFIIDYNSKTLTLNNYHGRTLEIISNLNNTFEDFTIILEGDSIVDYPDHSWDAIINTRRCNITITGNGTLIIGSFNDYSNYTSGYLDISGTLTIDGGNIIINNTDSSFNAICISSYQYLGGGDFTLLSGNILINMYPTITENDTMVKLNLRYAISLRRNILLSGGTFRVNYHYPENLNTDKEITLYYGTDEKSVFNSYIGNLTVTDSQVIVTFDNEYDSLDDINMLTLHYKNGRPYIGETSGIVYGSSIDITNLKMYLNETSFTFNGKKKEPTVTIPGLVCGEDFTVTYSNNINPGTGKAIVTGAGSFAGSCTLEFVIIKNPDYDDKDVDNGNDNAGEAKVGKRIKDKKYIYKVTKAGSTDGNIIGELKVIGLKKTSLKQIKIAAKVKIDGITYKVTSIGKSAFNGNKKVTKVTIGKNVKTIGNGAFSNIKKLKQVTINSTVLKRIGKNAFKNDKKLKKIIIKSTKLKSVGKNALKNTSKKLIVRVPKTKKKLYKKLFKKVRINP